MREHAADRNGSTQGRYPELQRAWEPVDALLAVVQEICEGDEVAAGTLATALEATAHGYAVLLLEDEPAAGPQEIAAAANFPNGPVNPSTARGRL